MKKSWKLLDRLSRVSSGISAAVLLACMTVYAVNSLTRFFLGLQFKWVEEGICYAIVVMIFLMLLEMDYEENTLSIGFLEEKLRGRPGVSAAFSIIRGAASLFTAAVMGYSGCMAVKQAVQFNSKSITTGVPYKYIYGIMLAGVIGMAVYWVYAAVAAAVGKGGRK